MLKKLLLVTLSLFIPALVYGQSAQLSGFVKDPSGASVPHATVELRNQDTGVRQQVTTNGDGIYSLPLLKPGTYVATVQAKGFKTLTRERLVLTIDEHANVDFSLEVGSTSEVVRVEGGQLNINATDGTVSTLVDATTVANMPLNGRSFQDLILLTPGVETNSPQQSNLGKNGIGSTGEFSVNGQRTESNYYSVDGASANIGSAASGGGFVNGPAASGSLAASTALGTTQGLVSVDDLQEFRVQSSSYSAEYGHNPGGQFGFETKSGTNQWHGDAYDYLRNNDFDANNWFNDFYGKPQQVLRQNDFGGALGGPVRIPHVYNGKDKTFFFVSYEGLRLTQPQAATDFFVPDACMQGVSGACAALNAQYAGTPAGAAIGYPTAGRSPAYGTSTSGLLPVADTFPRNGLKEYDPVNGVAQYITAFSEPGSINSTSVRLDQVITDRMTVFFRFSDTNSNTEAPDISQNAPQVLIETPFVTRTYTAGVNNIFSNRVSNELRFNYSSNLATPSDVITSVGGNTPLNLVSYLGLPSGSAPEIDFRLAGNNIFSRQALGVAEPRQWNVVDAVSYSVGAHQFKFGVDYRRFFPIYSQSSPIMEWQFISEPSVESGDYGAKTSGGNAFAPGYPLYINFAAFAQDTWKVSRRLTLSLGLRWDVNPAPGVTQGIHPSTFEGPNPNAWTLAPYGSPLWNTTWFNFAPRLGAAYVLRNTPGWETVVRGGGGVFFDTGQQLGSIVFLGPGTSANNTFPDGIFPANSTDFPQITVPPTDASVGSGRVFGFNPHLQLPYTLQWNLSVEQALGRSQALTVSYVGSHGSRLLQENQVYPTNNTLLQGEFFLGQNAGTSDYNALQAQYQRRLSRGLTVLGSYTWSHCIDYGSVNYLIPYLRGNCDFDVRHNVSAAFSYNLPNVGGNGFVRAILDHWGIDDRFAARTSMPVTMYAQGTFDPTTGISQPAYYYSIPGQPLYLYGAACASFFGPSNPTGPHVLTASQPCPDGRAINPCAFFLIGGSANKGCNPNPTLGGYAPRNVTRGFDAVQMDIAVRREFPIYGGLKLQFRAEAFNVLNHPNFGVINTGLNNAPQIGLATATLNNSLGVLGSAYQMGGPRSMQFALKLIF